MQTHKRQGEISYLSNKKAEYQQEIQEINSKQSQDKFDTQFSHPALVASAEQLKQLQELTTKLTEELASCILLIVISLHYC